MDDRAKEFTKKNKLPTGFADDVDGMDTEEIKKKVYECERNSYNIEQEKENDHKLNGAKDLVKDLSLPYNEALTAQKLKIKYCLFVLESRGEIVGEKLVHQD